MWRGILKSRAKGERRETFSLCQFRFGWTSKILTNKSFYSTTDESKGLIPCQINESCAFTLILHKRFPIQFSLNRPRSTPNPHLNVSSASGSFYCFFCPPGPFSFNFSLPSSTSFFGLFMDFLNSSASA